MYHCISGFFFFRFNSHNFCFNRGLVLFCDMLCYLQSYTDPLAHIYSRFLTGIIMKNEHRSNFPAGFVTQIRGI